MTLFHDEGLVRPLELDGFTARRIVAAVVLRAFDDVQCMEKRLSANPQARPKVSELDARYWLESEATGPFSYWWCREVLA
ncbi:MAG TPA: hypothetical protein VGU65_12605 [Frateuria sp.]|uniref:hypothetical protein n=1 Tax=Frateuria sp. TaxID=2211372 RepID=UPI002DEECB98|nr:hypothetical protein [Frateuria sp.]